MEETQLDFIEMEMLCVRMVYSTSNDGKRKGRIERSSVEKTRLASWYLLHNK